MCPAGACCDSFRKIKPATRLKSRCGRCASSPGRTCSSARQDLLKDPPFSNLDLISCRNVLIYLDISLQDRVMKLFHYGLNPGGFLLLGASENIKKSSDTFKPYDGRQRIYIKKQNAKQMLPVFPGFGGKQKTDRTAGGQKAPEFNLEEQVNSIILNEYSPPGIVVNDDYEILQFIGQPLPFLHPSPGRASLNLTRMARKELLVELRTAIYQAKKELQPVKREDVYLEDDQIKTKIRFEVVPFQNQDQSENYYLILFRQVSAPDVPALPKGRSRTKEPPQSETDKDREIRQLKKQLDVEREHLQKTIEQQELMYEELRSTNEEILSSNEELQSTNEELDTAQEELKATNEELNIINAELQDKNEALAQSVNDLNNLLKSVQIPLVILGNDLRIRHFTPACGEALNIRPEDRGRLITSIKLNFDLPELEKMVLQVIESLQVMEKEIRDGQGSWYSLQIRPYLTEEKKIDGTILSFVDIDVLKRSELAERQQKEDLFHLLERYGNDMVYRYKLAPKPGYDYVSPTAQKITGYSDQEFYQQPDLMLKIVQKEDQELAKGLFKPNTESGEPVRIRIVHKDGTTSWTEHRTLPITDEEGKIVAIQGMVRDVQAEEELKETSGRLRKLSAHMSDIKEEEGKRMSRKIHDEIGQNLVGLKMNLSSLFAKNAEQPDYPREEAENTMAFIDGVLKSVQHITSELRPGILDELGIFEAIEWYGHDFQKNTGITCSVRIEKNTPKPQDNYGIGIFRILQEILSNVRRHAGARAVSIRIFRKNSQFVMQVQDNGKGIKDEQINSPVSFGILGMKERAHNMGGEIIFEGKEGKGTAVTVKLPVKNLGN
ncbi:MAG: PAS domain-containing protein [Calditrichia bacterium]